jgi:uncharacterized protein involved in outer membrane biogenesis
MARGQKRSVGTTTVLVMAIVLALPVCAAIIFMATFDANSYKNEIETAVRRATGRDFTITGNISVASFASGTLAADRLVLANKEGGSRPEMMTVGRVEADLAFLPMLAGRIEIDRLVLQGPDLLLERDADGHDNWHFSRDALPIVDVPATAAPATVAPPVRRAAPVTISTLHVRDGKLHFIDRVTGRSALLEIKRLAATESAAGDRLQISAEVMADGRVITLSGQSGTLAQLLDPTPAIPFGLAITLQTAGAKLTVAGSVATPLKGAGYRFRVDGSSVNTTALSTALGLPPLPLRNVAFSAQVNDRGVGLPDVTGLTLRIGASDLDAWATGLKLEAMELSAAAMDQPIRAELRATMSGAELRATATLGAPSLLLPRGPDAGPVSLPVELALTLGQSVASAKGTISNPATMAGVDMNLQADITDLQAFAPLLGSRLPALRDLHFRVRLGDVPGGLAAGISLRDLTMTAPQGDLQGSASVRFGRPDAVQMRLEARRIDLDKVLEAFGGVPIAAPAAPSSNALPVGSPALPRRRLLISESRLGISDLARLDVDAHVAVGELVVRGVSYRNLQAEVQVAGGKLVAAPMSAELPGGKVELDLRAEAKGAESPVAMRLAAPGLVLKPLLTAFGRIEDVSGVLDTNIDLKGIGESPHTIAATLSGTIGLALENGEIDNAALAPLINSLQRSGRQMGLLEGPGRTRLRCAAIRMDFAGGVGSTTGFVLDSPRLLVQGAGQVNLGEETLALRLRPLLRTGSAGIVVPLRVEGTLREPRVAVDTAAAAVAAGEAALASQTSDGFLGKLGAALGAMAQAERGSDACVPALAVARGQAVPAASPASKPAPDKANPDKPNLDKPANLLRRLLR